MPLRAPLSIRINDGHTDRIVNQYAHGLKFTKVANGGHQTIECPLVMPRDTFRDLGRTDRLYVSDKRTAQPVTDGYLKNPTPVDGPSGQAYDLVALAGMWRASDETWPVCYMDQDLSGYGKDLFAMATANIEAGTWDTDETSKRLRVTIPGGGVAATSAFAGADNTTMQRARMTLGAITAYAVSGKDDPDYKVTLDHPAGSVDLTDPMSDTGTPLFLYSDDDFPTDVDYFSLRLVRTGLATNVADDTTWTDFVNLILLGQRYDRYGNPLVGVAGMVTATHVLASQVVEDLLSRLLFASCDPVTAQVDDTVYEITQLAYLDGTRAEQVLTDLATFEPDYYWGIGSAGANGLHEFWYRRWPTEPRYTVSVKDGWVETGSDTDLCSRQAVYWTDATGESQSVEVTAGDLVGMDLVSQAEIEALTWTRDADVITLPDGVGSRENALQLAIAVLLDKIRPPRAGKITVRRPILDRLTGNRVMPWELEPGFVCRVRELGYDLRVTQVDYDDADVSMVLTLGTPVLTDAQRLARLDAR